MMIGVVVVVVTVAVVAMAGVVVVAVVVGWCGDGCGRMVIGMALVLVVVYRISDTRRQRS